MSCPSKICNANGVGSKGKGNWLSDKATPEVKEGMKEFELDNGSLKKIMDLFQSNIERGLKKQTHESSIVKCFPTYVQDLPNGTEKGKFLALDLGGTNFRVLLVTLDVGKCDMKSDVYEMAPELMTGTGAALFDYIASCLSDFVKKQNLESEHLPLGFTFSFPLNQKGLRSGMLVRWTKGFNIPEIIGEDVVKWLVEAIDRRGDVKIEVCAVLNDTTGTLMSCAWKNPECRIGLIVGTGHNGCYYETQANAELFDEPDMGSGHVIINLEAAAFGDDDCLDWMRTDIDKQIDDDTINPGKQRYEKLISGMYLGELAIFETAMISQAESDSAGSFNKIKEILKGMDITDASDQDLTNIVYICQMISTRSAHLAGAITSVLVKRVDEPFVVVGIDGSVYKFHPHFKRLMKEKMMELVDPKNKFDLMLSEDGSGRGAALVAAMAALKAKGNAEN